MTAPMINRIGAWRRKASLIRDLADGSLLPEPRRQILLREARAADCQADAWLDAAMMLRDGANE